MPTHSFSYVDLEDLYSLEELVYRLLEDLLKSKPQNNPIADYRGGIRLQVTREENSQSSRGKYRLKFVIDFPELFEGAVSNEIYEPAIVHWGNDLSNESMHAFARVVIYRLAQLLLVSPLGLSLQHSAMSGRMNGDSYEHNVVGWFQLPPKTSSQNPG